MSKSESVSCAIRTAGKEELVVTGIRLEPWKCAVTLAVTTLMLGVPLLVFVWRKDWKIAALYVRCPLRQTKKVLIEVNTGHENSRSHHR